MQPNTKRIGEKMAVKALSGSSTGLGAEVLERTGAQGVYHAVLRGYKEQHKDEYLKSFKQLQDMRKKRDQLLKYAPVHSKEMIEKFCKDLVAFENYMESLTEIKAEPVAHNLVATVGKNDILDKYFAGSAYTAAHYLGLISSTSWSAVNAADTMSSHAGWLEAGVANTPTYSESTRRTAAWSSASAGAKAFSAGLVFTFTGNGTVKGCFLTTVSTKDGTTGILVSAGTFTGGDQPVVTSNTLTVSYSMSL